MSARPQVTITLGRSGHVVKRTGLESEVEDVDRGPSVRRRGKRPIQERLGNNSICELASRNKRQRSEAGYWNDDNMTNNRQHLPNNQIRQDDLRVKLMHKSLSRRMIVGEAAQSDNDYRGKYSHSNQIPLSFHARDCVQETKPSTHLRRIPAARADNHLLQTNSMRSSYSPWASNELRHRSPDRILRLPKAVSHPRTFDDTPTVRSLDSVMPRSYITKGVVDSSRSVSFMSKAATDVPTQKPIMRIPPASSTIPKNAFTVKFEEHQTVGNLLNSLGLGKYAILFQAEEVDMAALKQMSDNDLKDLGIPMGPRKKILLAVSSRAKQIQA